MNKYLKTFLPFVLLMISMVSVVNGQQVDLRFLKTYTLEDFGNSRQSWAFEQTDDGKIVVGNSNAINMFDGVDWSYTHVITGGVVFSLAKADEGRIYAGGDGEIGYIAPDSLNQLGFKSLVNKIDVDHQVFTQVRQTHYLAQRVYFRSLEKIIIYHEKEDSIHILTHEGKIYNSFEIEDKIVANIEGVGLVEVTNGNFESIEEFADYSQDRIYGLLPHDDKLLVYSREKGLKLFDGSRFEEFGKEINDYLLEFPGYRMQRIDSNRVAIGTLAGGLVIINNKGDILQKITTDEGLNNNYVYGLFVDNQDLLWVALDDGISVFDTQPVFEVYSENNGLSGGVLKIFEDDSSIIVITSQGAFYGNKVSNKFNRIENSPNHFYDAEIIGNYVFGVSMHGLFKISQKEIKKITATAYNSITSSNNSDYFVVGRDNVDKYSSENLNSKGVKIYKGELLSGHAIFLDTQLFLTLESGEIIHIDLENLSVEKKEIEFIDKYEPEYMMALDSEVYLGTKTGLFKYSEERDLFLEDNLFINDHIHKKQVSAIAQCGKNYWFRGNRKIVRYSLEDSVLGADVSSFNDIGLNEGIFTIDCGKEKVWFGGENTIYGIPDIYNKKEFKYSTNISGVLVHNDSLIYGGFEKPNMDIKLPFDDNELRFKYAAASYINTEQNTYQVKLEGFDNNWSDWTTETQKDYTNIPEGNYTFKVRSKNVYDIVGLVDSISFTILPPWYRTWWAYLLYTFTIAGLLFLAHRVRLNQILKVYRIRNNIASDLHDEVSATLSSISYFAQAIKSKSVKEDNNRFVQLISESAGDAKEKISDIVWAINPEHDDWQGFLSKCRRFASDLLESKDMKYSLKITENISGELNMQLRQHLWLIYKEMVTNAVRHSGARQLDVIIDYKNGKFELVVQDDGNGMDVDKVKKGNGLVNIHKRADEINGAISLTSNPGFGTRWMLKVSL